MWNPSAVPGGVRLSRPAEKIRLMEVLEAVEHDHFLDRCIYGFANCLDGNPCPLHEGWKPIKQTLEVYLNNHTIGDLVRTLPVRP